MKEIVDFLRDLKDEKLSEKNSKKRLILLKKYAGDDNDGGLEVGEADDDTGGYDKINVNLLRNPLPPAVDRSSKRNTHSFKDVNYEEEEETENEEEGEDDLEEESDDDDGSSIGGSSADSHQLLNHPTKSSDNKRNSMWTGESHSRITNSSLEGILYKKNKLKHKKYFAAVAGQHLLLSLQGFDNNNNRKSVVLKVNKDIDLDDYDVSITSVNAGKSELKLVCPGKKTHLFYCKDKREAEMWEKTIKKASKLKFASEDRIEVETANEESSIYVKNEVYEKIADKKTHARNSSYHSPINNNYNNTENYGVIYHPTEILKASSDSYNTTFSSTSTQPHKKGKKSKIQSLFDKVKKITSKTAADEDECLISGVLEIAHDGNHQWYCYIKENIFKAHKLNGSLKELNVPLHESNTSLVPCSDWLLLLLKSAEKEVQIKFKSHSELTKWYQVLVGQSGKSASQPVCDSAPEVLYDEIREVYKSDLMKAAKRPALPECPVPLTPDVNQVLMNINECSYMDAIECRGLIKNFGKKDNNVDDNTYANSGEVTTRDTKVYTAFEENKNNKNGNENENIYNKNDNENENIYNKNDNDDENIYKNMCENLKNTTTNLKCTKVTSEEPAIPIKNNNAHTITELNIHIENETKNIAVNLHTDEETDNKTDILKKNEASKANSNCGGVNNDHIAIKINKKNNVGNKSNNNESKSGNNKDYTKAKFSEKNKNMTYNANKDHVNVKNKYSSVPFHKKSMDTADLINKFSGGLSVYKTKPTTTSKSTITSSTKTNSAVAATKSTPDEEINMKRIRTTTSNPASESMLEHNSQKLSCSQTSLLRHNFEDNRNALRSKSFNKRFSDTNAIKGSLIMEKIKIFESRKN